MQTYHKIVVAAVALMIVASGSASAVSFGETTAPEEQTSVPDVPTNSTADDGQLLVVSLETGDRHVAPEGTDLSDLSLPSGEYRVVRAAGTDDATEEIVSIGSDGTPSTAPEAASSTTSLEVTTGHDYDWSFPESGTVPILVGALSDSGPESDVPVTVEIRNSDYETVDTLSGTTNAQGNVRFDYDLSQLSAGEYDIQVESSETSDSAYYSFNVGPVTHIEPQLPGTLEVDRQATLGIQVFSGMEPVSNVDRTVTIETPDGTTTTETVTTDSNGYATVSFTPSAVGGYQVSTEESDTSEWFEVQGAAGEFDEVTYDHQPGETVHLKGYLLQDKQPAANAPLTAVVTDTDDDTHYTNVSTTTSENGLITVSFTAPTEETDLDVELYQDGQSLGLSEWVSVSEYTTYEPSEYTVRVDHLTDWNEVIAPGETVPTKVEVLHNGEPVANQEVEVGAEFDHSVPLTYDTVTTDSNGVAYYNYTVPSDTPAPVFDTSLRTHAAVTTDGEMVGGTDHVGIGQYKFKDDRPSYHLSPGESVNYDATITDALTDDPVADLPLSMMGTYSSHGHGSVFAGESARTDSDGKVSLDFEIPSDATSAVYFRVQGYSGYPTFTASQLESSVSVTGDLTSGGEATVSYSTAKTNTEAAVYIINESNPESVVGVAHLTEDQDATIQLPYVAEETDFSAELRIISADGYVAEEWEWFQVSADEDANTPPTAAFTTTPTEPVIGESITFDASNSSDDGGITSYEWDFDGDGATEATGETVTHAFESAGEHDVTLTITDDAGATDSTTNTITVAQGDPVVSLEPQASSTQVNGSVDVDIVLDPATKQGVGAFDNITVSLTNTSVGTITAMESPFSGADTYVVDDGDKAAVKWPFGANTPDNGPIVLGTATVDATHVGETDLDLSMTGDISDENGDLYTISEVQDGNLTVEDGLPPVTGEDSPTDTDGDGKLEDVNGNGGFDIGDVQGMFANRNSETMQNNVEKFDFNNNGEVDIGDVQALFVEYMNS